MSLMPIVLLPETKRHIGSDKAQLCDVHDGVTRQKKERYADIEYNKLIIKSLKACFYAKKYVYLHCVNTASFTLTTF